MATFVHVHVTEAWRAAKWFISFQELEFEDSRVSAMKLYEYRVTAVNAGGESDASEPSKPIKAKKLKQAPKV